MKTGHEPARKTDGKTDGKATATLAPIQEKGEFRSLPGWLPLAGHHHHVVRLHGEETWLPRVDVEETEREYVLSAELAGVDRKDLKVEVRDGVLTLSGERREERESEGGGWLRRERYQGSFLRGFVLPENVSTRDAKASFKDGLLRLALPKTHGRKPADRIVKV